jgi:hypothetical protein
MHYSSMGKMRLPFIDIGITVINLNMGKNKPQCYAVSKGSIMSNGLSFGIFTKWVDCSQHVTGSYPSPYQSSRFRQRALCLINGSQNMLL